MVDARADLAPLIAAVRHDTPASALARLQRACEVAGGITTVADDLVDHFVRAARADGHSWTEIGTTLGVTKQAAQQRFAAPAKACTTLDLRLSARAAKAVRRAKALARRGGAGEASGADLVAALAADPNCLAVSLLDSIGVAAADVEQVLRRGALAGPRRLPAAPPPLDQVFHRAMQEATALRHESVGTEHLLLGLLGLLGELPVTSQVPALRGAYDVVRAQVIDTLERPQVRARRRLVSREHR